MKQIFCHSLPRPFKDYLQNAYARRSEWATSYTPDLPLWGNTTSNPREAAIRNLRNRVLARVRARNIVQLSDFLLTYLDDYYRRRVLAVVNCQFDDVLSDRIAYSPSGVSKEDITKVFCPTLT